MPDETVEVNEVSDRDWEEDQRRQKLRVKVSEKKLRQRKLTRCVCSHAQNRMILVKSSMKYFNGMKTKMP